MKRGGSSVTGRKSSWRLGIEQWVPTWGISSETEQSSGEDETGSKVS